MAPILAAVAQMTSTPSIAHNIRTVIGLIERASNLGAKIIFLPEAADLYAASLLRCSRRLSQLIDSSPRWSLASRLLRKWPISPARSGSQTTTSSDPSPKARSTRTSGSTSASTRRRTWIPLNLTMEGASTPTWSCTRAA